MDRFLCFGTLILKIDNFSRVDSLTTTTGALEEEGGESYEGKF